MFTCGESHLYEAVGLAAPRVVVANALNPDAKMGHRARDGERGRVCERNCRATQVSDLAQLTLGDARVGRDVIRGGGDAGDVGCVKLGKIKSGDFVRWYDCV